MNSRRNGNRDTGSAPSGTADRGIPSEADQLRAAAERFDRAGMGATAQLFRNAAWVAENGMEWLEWQRQDGRTDDISVREEAAGTRGEEGPCE